MKFNIYTLAAFVIYFILMIAIGFFGFKKSKNVNDYFLGGRQLGPWATAISAQASDMSGWLLLGLPGAVFLYGLTESWIAIGLFVGTYLNWKLIAARLRKMSAAAGDSITIPEYFQNRFKSQSYVVRFVCAAIIFVFFLVYTASAFSSGAKLFNFVFGIDYVPALTIGALIIISYTFLGGFLAVCWTDLVQGFLMLGALIIVPIMCIKNIPDFSSVTFNVANYFNLFRLENGHLAWQTIVSGLAWGLGYFGMPHILVRFMAIKNADLIKKSRIIACIWVFITLCASVFVGIAGNAFLSAPENAEMLAQFSALNDAEKIFMFLSTTMLPALIAGVVLSAILAAIMSTADSQLLVTASAVTNDVFKILKKETSEKTLMWISRGTVIIVAIIAYLLALNPDSSVMGLVSYAWAGLGAAFGPAMLLSLFWKRMTIEGAVAGMVSGGLGVIVWEAVPVLSGTGVYSLLPAFILSLVAIVVASLLTKEPEGINEMFEKAKSTTI